MVNGHCSTLWSVEPDPLGKQSVSLLSAIQANGFWLLPMQVYLLLNTPAFSGRTIVDNLFSTRPNLIGFPCLSHQKQASPFGAGGIGQQEEINPAGQAVPFPVGSGP